MSLSLKGCYNSFRLFHRGVSLIAAVFFLSGCGIKMNNPVSTIAKALGLKGEISDFDVSSSSLKGGSSITIPFSISFSDGSEVSQIKLQFASDGMTFKDVDQVIDPSATSVTWPVPKGDFSQARLQLVVTSSAGKTSTQVSSVFSIDSTLPSAPSVSLVSSNPSNSPNASFTVSDCSDISWVYTSQSSNALSDLNSSLALSTLASDGWMECSTAAAAVNFTVSPNSGLKTIYFWAKDAAGNISTTSTVVTLTLDTSTPTASFSSPTTGSIITLADVTAFTMTGSCSAQGGSIKLSLSDGSETVSSTTTCNTSASPNWSIALNASTLSDTSSNGITAILVHTNPAGSSSSPQTRTFNKNTVTSGLAVAITSPANGGFSNNLNDASFPISGTCSENGRTVSVSATDGSTTINDTPTCTLGAWSSNLDLTTLGTSITLDATHTNVGGSSVNATSVSITKDLINPNNAGSPAWVEASPSTTNTVTATWTKSNSGDLANQSLQYYSDGTCAAASGAPVSAALASTQAFTGTSGTWSYKIMSYDSAGNINTSACSTAILLKEASLAQSTLTLSPSSIVKGQISSLSLIIKDPSGVQNTLGGYTVTFSASAGAGVSTGTISATTDNGNGTYTATFTGTVKGTATTITATITGLGAVTQTQNITVGNTAPVIIPLAASTYPLNTSTPPAIQGNSVTLATATDADSDTVTLNCTYQTLGLHASDPNYAAAGTNCTTLDTITAVGSPAVTVRSKMTSSTSGSLVWTPTSTQRGTYQFTISGTDGTANASTQTVNVAVRGAYTNTNLLSALDALNATNASGLSASTPSAPFTSAATAGSWLNLFSSASNGTLTFGTTNPWGGTGQSSTSAVDPYALTLNQANSDSLSLGTALSAATQFSTETWVKPSPLPSASPAPIIIGNGGATGDGFVLRQSQITPDRAEFVVGQKYYSYKDLILSDKPIGYWRLNEASGTIAYDLTAYGRNAGYPASSITYGAAGVLAGDSDSSINITGDVTIFGPASVNPWGGNFSIEFWANPSSLAAAENMVMSKEVFSTNGFRIFANNVGRWVFSTAESGGSIVAQSGGGAASVGNWSHVVVTFDSTASRATIYVNGTQRSSTTGTFVVPAGGFRISSIGWYWLGKLDDVAVYDYTLASSQVTEHYQTGINGNYKAYPGNAILANKPTAYWRLGEKSGTIAYDYSGNGYDGTYTGVSLNQTRVLSNDSDTAATFSGGTSSYLSTNASINFTGTSPFTASAWFKTSNGSNFPQLLNNSDNTDGWYLYLASGQVRFQRRTGGVNNTIGSTLSTYADGNWHYAVGVYTGSYLYLYVDGVSVATPVSDSGSIAANSSTTHIAGMATHLSTEAFTGTIDEVAVYNYPLSLTQIAAHYNSGKGPGWWTCQSQTQMNNSNWNLLSTLYDGTTAKLFVNGQQECSVTPGTSYSGSVANTVLGSNPGRTSAFWQGVLSSLKIFGTSNATAPATATTIKANFDSEANRYRSTPVENIVTNGLVLNLDAANAKQGLAPYSNGCGSTDLTWFNLSNNSSNGTLKSFGSCGASVGWVGSGTVLNPYALTFDGTPNYVEFENNSNLAITGDLTVEAWVYPTDTTGTRGIIGKTSSNMPGSYDFYILNGAPRLILGNGGSATGIGATATVSTNTWAHLAATVSGASVTHYKNGASIGTGTNVSVRADAGKSVRIGSRDDLISKFLGSIATARIYNRALTAQEIKQNCLTQERRFTNTPNSICTAP